MGRIEYANRWAGFIAVQIQPQSGRLPYGSIKFGSIKVGSANVGSFKVGSFKVGMA
jgi:hypothetical protein